MGQRTLIPCLTRAMRKYWFNASVGADEQPPNLLNNESLLAINAAGTGTVALIKANASNEAELPGGLLKAATGNNFVLNTASDDKQVRLNSRNFIQASGSSIGFQAKPAQSVSSSGSVIGGEISPRLNSGIALSGSGSVIGLHVDAYLKGTAAGTVAGDVRGLQIEMVTDDGGTRTVSGNVSALRIRSCFSATTITGKFVPVRIEFPEVQTNSKVYDAAFEFTGKNALAWNDDPATELNLPAGTVKGYIGVLVNGAKRYIALYEAGNLAD